MSILTIDNLNENRELDRTAAADTRGGFYGPAFFETFIASFDFTEVTQNAVNLNVVSGVAGVNSIGSISAMPVSAGSAMNVIKGVGI